jgi:hypothetical protein
MEVRSHDSQQPAWRYIAAIKARTEKETADPIGKLPIDIPSLF